jgi:hypothetical protein
LFAEASTILRAVSTDFFFHCWYLEIPSDDRIRHLPRCVHCHAQAVPESYIPLAQIVLSIVLYMRSLLLVESFDFRPSNKYILVRVIPS